MMNEKKLVHNFKSYLGLENPALKSSAEKNGTLQELQPKLLSGELVIGVAHNVQLCAPLTERSSSLTGSLFVTNFKLSFVLPDSIQTEVLCQRNLLLGLYDVSLTNVGAIWMTDGQSTMRRRRLVPFGPMPSKVKGLQVICKNMKVMTFSFKHSPVGQGKTIAASLLHHAFPKKHHLLFAYDYTEPYYPTLSKDMNMFHRPGDWKRELERTGCPHWRITYINGTSDAFMSGANESLIVPSSALDYNLIETSRHFRSGRIPIWVWGLPEGAALLRSGELLSTEQSATAESVLLEQVRRSHPKLTAPQVLYLCGNSLGRTGVSTSSILPPLSTLQTSYRRLIDLCTPATLRSFWEQDNQLYSSLDTSRWLYYVAACISFAEEAAMLLNQNVTVVLQEGDGMDYSAVVSSLIQLLMDPHTRTIDGFQSLLQKEWIALGHPFCDRLGHLTTANPKEKEQLEILKQSSPVFLLFLDCCWQLLQQFPSDFQFTDTYLTTLWDSAHNQIFDTFIFNCPRDRELAASKSLILRSVWDWEEQFGEQDLNMFRNPLYCPPVQSPKTAIPLGSSTPNRASVAITMREKCESRLRPATNISDMEFWSQCYERWLPPLDLPGGGNIQYQVHNYATVKQIAGLREQLSMLPQFQKYMQRNRNSTNGERDFSIVEPFNPVSRPLVSAFYPFSNNKSTESCQSLASLDISLIDPNELLDSQSLLNAVD